MYGYLISLETNLLQIFEWLNASNCERNWGKYDLKNFSARAVKKDSQYAMTSHEILHIELSIRKQIIDQ